MASVEATTSAASATDSQIQVTLDALASAVRADDRASWVRFVSPRDPDFARVAMRVFDNLSGSPLTTLNLDLVPGRQELAPGRRALLGTAASVRAVRVDWRLRGDDGVAEHRLWLTFSGSGPTVTLAGLIDGPIESVAQPFWLLESLTPRQVGRTTVLVGSGTSTADWLRRGNAAVMKIRPRLPHLARAHWNGDLVLEVPSTQEIFERLLGVTAGSYAQIAAVAWPEGPDPTTAAIRIVVNPGLANRLDEQGLSVLLTHEATHIATRSAASPAPTWLVEGFADYVAYDAYPMTASTAASALLARVRDGGAPTELPANSAFSPTAPDLPGSYAQSWLACRFLAETYGAGRLARFYAEVDGGASVDLAARHVFGRGSGDLTAAWGSYLRTLAERR